MRRADCKTSPLVKNGQVSGAAARLTTGRSPEMTTSPTGSDTAGMSGLLARRLVLVAGRSAIAATDPRAIERSAWLCVGEMNPAPDDGDSMQRLHGRCQDAPWRRNLSVLIARLFRLGQRTKLRPRDSIVEVGSLTVKTLSRGRRRDRAAIAADEPVLIGIGRSNIGTKGSSNGRWRGRSWRRSRRPPRSRCRQGRAAIC